jgi:hypothetical protein
MVLIILLFFPSIFKCYFDPIAFLVFYSCFWSIQNLTEFELAKMPSCNLAKISITNDFKNLATGVMISMLPLLMTLSERSCKLWCIISISKMNTYASVQRKKNCYCKLPNAWFNYLKNPTYWMLPWQRCLEQENFALESLSWKVRKCLALISANWLCPLIPQHKSHRLDKDYILLFI